MQSFLSPENWIFLGIFVTFLLGSFLHFVYAWSGNNKWLASFVPINESVWEHTKLSIFPILFWWIFYFFFFTEANPDAWFTGCLVAMVTSIIITPLLFYFYTQAFQLESLWIDIFIFFLSILGGQLLGYHVYCYSNGFTTGICFLCFAVLVFFYFLTTFFPPHIALFQDGPSKTYGIHHVR